MAELTFEQLQFEEKQDFIRVTFLNIFYFDVKKEELNKISDFKIEKNKISFKNISEKSAENKFNLMINKGFENLRNKINNKKTIYIHKNSGIPLIGTIFIGLIDRNSNIIEVKPVTGCNLDCIYCSVNETQRYVDFVVEKDYLIQEFKKLVELKSVNNIEAHINAQGEPLLYAPLADLIKDLKNIPQVKTISIDTNGTLLTEKNIEQLAKAGLTRFNISLNALTPEIADKIANKPYNTERIKKLCAHIIKHTNLLLAPVWIPGINDKELPKIIEFAKTLKGKYKVQVGIQNFLNYKFGRNPVKQAPFDLFYEKLRDYEKKYNIDLVFNPETFKIIHTKPLPKPFKKGDKIKAEIVMAGRFPGEMIAAAKNRCISILNSSKQKGTVKLRIIRSKHNIFIGTEF